MVSGIEFCERKLDRISLKSSEFLSERNNLAGFTTSFAIGAFVSIQVSVLRTSPTIGLKFMISSLGFILYMHFLVEKIWWNLQLKQNEYPRSKRFRNLYALGKTVVQTFVLRFIVLLGDLVSEIEDVSYFLVLGFALIFLHLVLLSKFFYMLEDFGLLDGFFTLFFGTATHLYRSPLGQFLVMLFAYLVLLVLHLRYAPCCEENHAKKEEERRSRQEAEKIAKEKDEEEKRKTEKERKAREEEEKRKAREAEQKAEEVVKKARDEAKKAKEALVKARDEADKARDEVKKASDELNKAREKKDMAADDEKMEADEEFDKTSKKADEAAEEDNKAREREAEAIKEEEKARERESEAVGELEKLRRG
ncbi:hypothetical protein F2Q70_00023869 [Brassica cretica]|uniref:Uncharacterized protein n=1 Tax=Brassica cretica TaxID=69181 RepID=A0A8S9GUE0_BRACR|nr:hypothetical protein F2Q70_00023869 [Brassica cretica]